MSDFTTVPDNKTEGIIRYKGRKCGVYTLGKDEVEVDISTATGQNAWENEFGEDKEKINAFFNVQDTTEDVQTAPPVDEPTAEVDDVDEEKLWRDDLLRRAGDDNIATVLKNGNGRIYEGPPTEENIKEVLALEDVAEVLNANSQGN